MTDEQADECIGAICGALAPMLVPTAADRRNPHFDLVEDEYGREMLIVYDDPEDATGPQSAGQEPKR